METTTKPSTAGIALKWGAITGLVAIIYNTILQVTGLALNQAVSSLAFVILIGGIVYGMKEFKTQTGGYMSYGEGLGLGSLLSAVYGLLASAFGAIYIKYIDDSTMKKQMEIQRQAMEQRGMDDAQIDQAIQMAEKFTGAGSIFVMGLLGSLLIGFIISLVVAAIMKKERTELI
ncbi:MAG: DUF4199 domain-containing protein [Bacteroidota bacterium]